ncbi:MAG: hypothetical protein ACHQ1G_00080 [Planctomycetota bacterium]
MTAYRFSSKQLPHGAESYVLDYQEKGVNFGTENWAPLAAKLTDAILEFDLVHRDDVRFRLRVRDLNGLLSKPAYFMLLADKPAPAAVPAPAVTVSQDGPALLVEPEAEEGHDVEVRTSAAATEAHDALPSPFQPGCCEGAVPLVPDAESQLVHARLVRRSDGLRGPWTEVSVPVADPDDWGTVEDHPPGSVAFPGTIGEQGGKPTLVVTSAGLEPLELPRAFHADNDARAFNAINERRAFAPHNFPTRCVYEADEIVMASAVDFRLQCFPGSAVTRAPVRAFARTNRFPFRRPRRIERTMSDIEADRRTLAYLGRERRAFNAEEDRDPPSIAQEVSTTQDGSSWTEYAPVPHGRDIEAKGVRTRLVIVPPLGPGQGLVIPDWTVRRRRRNRKWEFVFSVNVGTGDKTYTFDPVPRVMNVSSLAAAVSILRNLADVNVSYSARIVSLTATAIRIIVAQRVRGQVVTAGGVATWTYPAAFGATPRIVVTPLDVSHEVFAGHETPGTSTTTVYATVHDGTPADVPVDCTAEGPPANGVITAHVVLTGF